ncbi:cytochrome c-type biogenesis protein CcmH [Sinobacterium caligoides]|uniref:Cytochrome c-type biogenesis protein CcmH n=1 Tax=Sinobacterium caligoides TaxID=933926 RepID=A0A3N2DXX7_9GAMM|nr:c-type cytochrome biogenesis protein CcmI [Sinobacterium caligoides]ROS04668.1 cytochrome c-type biogenesis protein CcmH [Sinobacterium caligoides]
MMIEFIIIAALMLLFAIAIVVVPVLGKHSVKVDTAAERKAMNVAAFKQRQGELELELTEQRLSEGEFERLLAELKLSLLEDTEGCEKNVASYAGSKLPVVICAGVLALMAIFAYGKLGAIDDVIIAQQWQKLTAAGESGAVPPKQLELMTNKLAQQLEGNDNPGNLYLLASLKMREENFKEAAAIFKRLVKLMPGDMSLAAEYVQSEYLANDRKIDDRLKMIIERILKADPNQPTLLALVAMDAYTLKDYPKALTYWKRLQRVTPPNTRNGQLLADTVRHVEGLANAAVDDAAKDQSVTKVDNAVPAASISVSIALADGVSASATDTVFVYARAVDGPKMPLAIHRTTVASLPLTVTLDDSMSMMAGMNMSSFEQVEIIARITKSGKVSPSKGDWQAVSAPLSPKKTHELDLLIDKQL